jgi:hypothetical protein
VNGHHVPSAADNASAGSAAAVLWFSAPLARPNFSRPSLSFFYDLTSGSLTPRSAAAVPGPVAGAGLPGLIAAALLGLSRWRRRRRIALTEPLVSIVAGGDVIRGAPRNIRWMNEWKWYGGLAVFLALSLSVYAFLFWKLVR